MHPQIRQPEPGKCPICGMDLIPLEDDNSAAGDPADIRMSPTAMQLANVQTAVVGYGTPVREVRMNGTVRPDERLVFSQVTHLSGRVEQLAVNYTGEPVRRGQRLATIYSPELVTAQEELFSALKIKDLQPGLFRAAQEKLKNWKLTDSQIQGILADGKPQARFPILADAGGIVLAKKVNAGDYLMRGMPLYDLVDLSRVWVLFDLYETDIPWAKIGSRVDFTVQSVPGETFSGKITFIDPVINPATRVATARVEVPNAGGTLKPEMFASGVIKTRLAGGNTSLLAPQSAVLWTGERSVVYVKTASDRGIRFRMQEVRLGPLVGDAYVIRQGLDAGAEIAVNGAFSIDAAAQLAGKPSMMGMTSSGGTSVPEAGAPVSTRPVNINAAAPGAAAKAAVQQLFDRYFPLKDALVKDDLATARKCAEALKNGFGKTGNDLFAGTRRGTWARSSGAAVDALTAFIGAKDIDEARKYFKPLSRQMVGLAEEFGPFKAPIYVQHCPMADNNTGADWLSLDTKIRNPYFGDEMLTCGSVTETIKK